MSSPPSARPFNTQWETLKWLLRVTQRIVIQNQGMGLNAVLTYQNPWSLHQFRKLRETADRIKVTLRDLMVSYGTFHANFTEGEFKDTLDIAQNLVTDLREVEAAVSSYSQEGRSDTEKEELKKQIRTLLGKIDKALGSAKLEPGDPKKPIREEGLLNRKERARMRRPEPKEELEEDEWEVSELDEEELEARESEIERLENEALSKLG